jgi:hypothetical protein
MGEKPQKPYESNSDGPIALPVLNMVPSPVSPSPTEEVITPKSSYPEVSGPESDNVKSISSRVADAPILGPESTSSRAIGIVACVTFVHCLVA